MANPDAFPGSTIMVDGPDGIGKTIQIALARDALVAQGRRVHTTRAHGGTPIGEMLREVSLSHTPRSAITDLLISRAIHAELAIDLSGRKEEGYTNLVDRGPGAMWAYQVHGSGLDPEVARPIVENDFTMIKPDLVIVYTTSLDILKSRRASRHVGNDDYFETKDDDYRQRVIDGYIEAAGLFDCQLIDASGDIPEVHALTMAAIGAELDKHK